MSIHYEQQLFHFLLKKTQNFEPGHDYYHSLRVYNMALHIAKQESADFNIPVITIASLFHDLVDPKIVEDPKKEKQEIIDFLITLKVSDEDIVDIFFIIESMSYSKRNLYLLSVSQEFQIVQDADRLDAIGAIGIARVFSYSGKIGRSLHIPDDKNSHTAINHFYEKLLKLKDLMNTQTAKQIAIHRHKIMEDYLQELLKDYALI